MTEAQIPRPPHALIDAVEGASVVDGAGAALGKAIRGANPPGPVRDALSGTWIGHALHPPLTDVVIGAFLSASVLDVVAPGSPEASERLLLLGLLASLPTAISGATDWADTEIADVRVRRIGLAHAAANVSGLALAIGSIAARRRGPRWPPGARSPWPPTARWAWAASWAATCRSRSAWARTRPRSTPGPADWTDAAGAADVAEGEPTGAIAGDTPVLLLRHDDRIHAIHDRCSHRGCLLSDGEVEGHVVTCPCHGSRFDVRDGSIVRGPATAAQPVLEVREDDGRINGGLAGAD